MELRSRHVPVAVMRNHFNDALLLSSFLTVVSVASGNGVRLVPRTAGIIPLPLVVPPSQYCEVFWILESSCLIAVLGDGVDGLWSSFALRVGTPAQIVRALVSTNSPETMVVLPLGCTKDAINPVPRDCANSRGGLFNLSMSTTWDDQGLFGINGDGVGLEANLGYSQNAEYGLETLGLGFEAGGNAPTLQNQTVAAIATGSPFYL